MKTPLLEIEILSIYKTRGQRILLPPNMARCTPDTHNSLLAIRADVQAAGSGDLFLSDFFRTYDMQLQAYLEHESRKKAAFSPRPGGSLHEAGRAFDLDLKSLKISLSDFWEIASAHGCSPIIENPDSTAKEAWHFDCRGSHQLVYDYYVSGKGTNLKPYEAMAVSAILALGISVDKFKTREKQTAMQSGLIRLGYEIGNMDGEIDFRINSSLEEAGIAVSDIDSMLLAVENLLQQKFPEEY